MQIPKKIETKSLYLRALVLDDTPLMFESLAKDLDVARYMSWKHTGDYKDTEDFVKGAVERWAKCGDSSEDFAYAICLRESGKLIGTCSAGPHSSTTSFHWGIGYQLARASWGKGLGTEAVTSFSRMVIELPGVYRVSATVDIENPGSARVLEKSGFSCEGTFRRYAIHPNAGKEPRDVFIYSLVK